jgi:hypothetical protein
LKYTKELFIFQFKEDKKDERISNKTIMEIAEDLNDSIQKNFQHFSPEEVKPIRGSTNYFNKLVENIDKYVYRQDNMLKILKSLKNAGKTLFILSNSHFPYINETMNFAYGKVSLFFKKSAKV